MKVMEEITSGNTHPRLLEVMGQLQDKMASITKTQANYVLFLEDTYKKLNNESPVNPDSTRIESSSNEGKFFISVGTKNVIENLPQSEYVEDEVDNKLIDPTNKSSLLRNKEIDIDSGDDLGEDFIDLTEII